MSETDRDHMHECNSSCGLCQTQEEWEKNIPSCVLSRFSAYRFFRIVLPYSMRYHKTYNSIITAMLHYFLAWTEMRSLHNLQMWFASNTLFIRTEIEWKLDEWTFDTWMWLHEKQRSLFKRPNKFIRKMRVFCRIYPNLFRIINFMNAIYSKRIQFRNPLEIKLSLKTLIPYMVYI